MSTTESPDGHRPEKVVVKRVRRNLRLDPETSRRIDDGSAALGINPGSYVGHAVAAFEGFEIVRAAKRCTLRAGGPDA